MSNTNLNHVDDLPLPFGDGRHWLREGALRIIPIPKEECPLCRAEKAEAELAEARDKYNERVTAIERYERVRADKAEAELAEALERIERLKAVLEEVTHGSRYKKPVPSETEECCSECSCAPWPCTNSNCSVGRVLAADREKVRE